jgi:glucose-1-phosphate adenylyltransferase
MRKQKWMAMLLAGGKGTRLEQLTRTIVKPAIPFGGKYRIIDFALSNCKNSGIDTIGILTQYKPLALHTHLENEHLWNLYSRNGGMTILPPLNSNDHAEGCYEGTSHAVYRNMDFIEQYEPDYVLILAADQIYKMNFESMLKQHIETKADCTIAVVDVHWEEAHRFGLIKMDKLTHRIKDFEEKPVNPTTNLASMGIYIFNYEILKEYLIREEQKVYTHRDFGKDIIPSMLYDQIQLYAYPFKGYWRDVGTVHSYWEANLDLLNMKKNIFLQDPNWRIHTVDQNEPPSYFDEQAKVHHSLVSEGCEIYGNIERSVIFNGVKIKRGAVIRNSVILPGTIVEENVWIENAVIGSQSLVKNGVIIVSKSPELQLMVIGNYSTIDPSIMYDQITEDIKPVS